LSAILAGAPILFAAGWLAARGARPDRAALIPAAAYMVLDLVLIGIGGVWPPLWTLAVSYLTKFAASYAGGRLAPRQALLQ